MTTIKLKIDKEEFKKKLGMETKVIEHVLPAEEADVLRDKLETLEGDERLDAKAIKNLPKPIINSGGIQRIDQALDTNIEAPTDGQTLTYDADTKQWVNSDGTPGGGGTWGSITGNLSDQTDLQTALDAKADNSDVVHTTGDEDIDGIKNLLSSWTFALNFALYGKVRTTDGAGYQLQLASGDAKGEGEAAGAVQISAGNADSSATNGIGGPFYTIAGASRGSGDGPDNIQTGGSSQDGRGGHSINKGGQSNGAGVAGEGRIEGADGATGNQDGGHTGAIGGAPNGSGLWGRFYIRTQLLFAGFFNGDGLTANRQYTLPDLDGTLAVTSQIPDTTSLIAEEFETVSKNLKSYPYDITYDIDDNIDFIEYDTGSGLITKTFGYTSGDVTTITLSGSTPGGIDLIKTFTYSSGQLTSVAYS